MAWRAGLTSGTINLEWHQFARLGDFPMPSCSLGIMMGKADDWNPPGLGKAGRGGVGIEVPGRMNDVANHRQVDRGGSRARKGLTAWQSASSKASTPVP